MREELANRISVELDRGCNHVVVMVFCTAGIHRAPTVALGGAEIASRTVDKMGQK